MQLSLVAIFTLFKYLRLELSITTFSIVTLNIMVEYCYAVSLVLTVGYAECRKLALYTGSPFAEWHYAKCRSTTNVQLEY
jgi:hypothetical protein